jgi:pimeloyl-ACP methyl ester carboxylesterase
MATTGSERLVGGWTQVRMLDTSSGPVEVAVAGSGPPVLVVHGTPGSWRQCFSLAEDLADSYTVVAPSRPGYGRTPVATGRTFSEQAAAYAGALDELGLGRAVVVGASGGGPSSVAFAAEHRERCAGLVLACALVADRIAVPALLRLLAAGGVGEAWSRLDRFVAARRLARPASVDKWIRTSLTPDELKRALETEGMREDLIAFARSHLDAPPGLAGVRNDLAQVRAAKRAGPGAMDISVPTLVMHGDADPVVGMDHARHHAASIPGAELEVYEDAGHAFFFTRRAEVAERLRRFLSDVGHGAVSP